MVIYTGKNTKILQRYSSYVSRSTFLDPKNSKVSRLANKICLTVIFISFAEAILSYIIMISDTIGIEFTKELYSAFDRYPILKSVDVIIVYLSVIPYLSLVVLEFASFMYGIQIERRFLKGSKAQLQSFNSYRRSNRSTSNNSEQGKKVELESSPSRFNRGATSPDESTPARARRIRNLSITPQMASFAPPKNIFNEKGVKVIDYRVLGDLGNVEHIVFDKTDTLTLGSIEIKEICTVKKVYKIEESSIASTLAEVVKNPEKFRKSMPEENQQDLDDAETYSEKSQEFKQELAGNYLPKIFDELSNDELFSDGVHFGKHHNDSDDGSSISSTNNPGFISNSNLLMPTNIPKASIGGRNLRKLERNFLEKLDKLWNIHSPSKPRSMQELKSNFSRNNSESQEEASEEHGQELQIDPNKLFEHNDFLYDYYSHETDLINLVAAMRVCHEARRVEGSKSLKSHHYEERALLDLCKKLGMEIEEVGKENGPFTAVYKIKKNNITDDIIKVIGINTFRRKRGRMSVIIHDAKEGKRFTLFVRGEEKNMRSILKLDDKGYNTLKKITLGLKAKGLNTILFGKKELSQIEVQNFVSNHQVISKMSRGQEDNFDKLANEYEFDLEFLGCIAVKEHILEEAFKFTKNIQSIGLRASVLTGDSRDNCLIVTNELGISTFNMSDSSQYYNMIFKSENEAYRQINRVLESIYESEKINSVYKFEKKKAHKPIMMTRAKMDLNAPKRPQSFEKSILINGESVEVLMKFPNLSKHFQCILYFSCNVIGYSMNSEHKAYIVQCMKRQGRGAVLAIGDGFNDIAMLKEADVGVQLYHRDVPMIFGDIVIKNMDYLNYLVFAKGKTTFDALNCYNFYILSTLPTLGFLLFFINLTSNFSSRVLEEHHLIALLFSTIPPLLLSVIWSKSYSSSLLELRPEFYLERRSLQHHRVKIYGICLLLALIDSVIFFVVEYIIVATGRAWSSPITPSQSQISINLVVSISLVYTMKLAFFDNKSIWKFVGFGFGITLLTIIMYELISIFQVSLEPELPILRMLMTEETFIGVFYNVGLSSFINLPVIHFLKKSMITPMYYKACEHASHGNKGYFDGTGLVSPIIDAPVPLINNPGSFIRRIFKGDRRIESELKKIMTLNTSSYNLGMNKWTCRISDKANNKRYNIFKRGWDLQLNRFSLGIFWLSILFYAIFLGFISELNYLFLDTWCIYILLLFSIPFLISWYPSLRHKMALSVNISIVLLFITIVMFMYIFGIPTYPIPYTQANRLFQGPLQIDFMLASCWLVLNSIFEMMSIYSEDAIHSQGVLFIIKAIFTICSILASAVLFKQKLEVMAKIDFLAKLRISQEARASDEKLRMLMPNFVLKMVNNYEISKNFVVGDAGEVTILFCDICRFDEVMKQCSESVIEILDDVFRQFDLLCKKYHLQKIETVGKTYMVCGGLKVVEEKLSDDQKLRSPCKRTIELAVDMMEFIHHFTYGPGCKLNLKIGIHYGNCIFGVLGYHKHQFSLIGDTVNTTARHCTTGPDGRIIISESAYHNLEKHSECSEFTFDEAMVPMKGKGLKKTYILVMKNNQISSNPRLSIKKGLSYQNLEEDLPNLKNLFSSDARNEYEIPSPKKSRLIDFDQIHIINADSEAYQNSEIDIDQEMQKERDKQKGRVLVNQESDPSDASIQEIDNQVVVIEDKKPESNRTNWNRSKSKKVTENEMTTISVTNSNLSIFKPFNKEQRDLENQFLITIFAKNSLRIRICLWLLIIEQIVYDLMIVLEPTQSSLWVGRAIGILVTIFLGMIIIVSRFESEIDPVIMKYFYASLFFMRFLARLYDITMYHFYYEHLLLSYCLMRNHYYSLMFETVMINIIGAFYFMEIVCYNFIVVLMSVILTIGVSFQITSLLHYVILFIELGIFNIGDNYISSTRELGGFINIMKIENKSLQLSQYVNRLLPKHIQDSFSNPDKKQGEYYENVTLLYADIVGFTDFSNKHSARQVVAMLSNLFTDFDKECNRLSLFKIYTIGDCYVVMGLLDKNNRREAKEEANGVAQMGISMIRIINQVRKRLNINLNMRIGIHTGNIYGGILGTDIVRFDIFGADVVVANKMESNGTPGKINVSEKTKTLLESLETCNYTFEVNQTVNFASLGFSIDSFFLNYDAASD